MSFIRWKFGDGRSPSGKAPDFGSGIEGSNPSRPASFCFSTRNTKRCRSDHGSNFRPSFDNRWRSVGALEADWKTV